MEIYLSSVGRGANLILNLAPNRDGRLDPADVASLEAFGKMRRKGFGGMGGMGGMKLPF